MKYYIIEPEVAGNIADSDFIDRSARPPKISRLKYKFDGWLGDDMVESIMTFIITEKLKEKLETEILTGYEFDKVEVITSEQFEELYSDKNLPDFVWLKIIGIAGKDDFGMSEDNDLVISEKVYKLLSGFQVSGADFTDY